MIRSAQRHGAILTIVVVGVTWLIGAFAIVNFVASPVVPSDRFWGADSREAVSAESYDSLNSMRDSADAVVLGQVARATEGRSYVADPAMASAGTARFLVLHFVVERGIRGPFQAGDIVPVEILVRSEEVLKDMTASPPPERSILFLRNKGAEAAALGYANSFVQGEAPYFRLVHHTQGVIRDVRGRVALHPAAEDGFLTKLEGTSFDSVVQALVN